MTVLIKFEKYLSKDMKEVPLILECKLMLEKL
jgi:hypothetical protein